MARNPRRKSFTNIYHAVLRGNERKTIFFSDQDCGKFLEALDQKKKVFDCAIYAWCLMPNHIHLLIKERSKPLGSFFQGLGSSFVSWYNKKYDRVGHLFQGRYYTEPVVDSGYFLNVIRYIHMNPVKANICTKPEDYPYSSYRNFFCSGKYSDDDMLYDLIRIDEFRKYHLEKAEDFCLDIDASENGHLTDGVVIALGRQYAESGIFADLKDLPKDKFAAAMNSLLKTGATPQQIDRLLKRPGTGMR